VIKFMKHPQSPNEPIKGVGEASTTGVPAAVIRALEKAIGKRLRKTPLGAEEILLLTR
jgi:aerobic carbon-monoxide dehydrogenase large subunit